MLDIKNKEGERKGNNPFSYSLKSLQTLLSSFPFIVDNGRDNNDTSQTDQNEN